MLDPSEPVYCNAIILLGVTYKFNELQSISGEAKQNALFPNLSDFRQYGR